MNEFRWWAIIFGNHPSNDLPHTTLYRALDNRVNDGYLERRKNKTTNYNGARH